MHLANHLDLGRVNIVEEIVSGKISWKRGKIAEFIEEFTKGDILIISGLTQLGRSMLECMEINSVAVKNECGFMPSKAIGRWTIKAKS